MIKEAIGFGNTVEEAKENAILKLNAAEDADIQIEVIATPKKKTLGLFGGRQAEVKVYIELPDEKPKAKKSSKPQKKDNHTKRAEAKAPKKAEVKEEAKAEAATSKKYDPKEGYGEAKDEAEISPDTKAGKAISYLRTILESLGCTDIKIKVAEKENAALIELDGEGLGVVIGHRGETLDSLQYLTSLAANNGGGYYKISLNIGNYREKREEALVSLAKRVAEQVLRTKRSRALEPMNPYERRIIHTAVQSIDGVVSNSFGEGIHRRVVIAAEGGDIRPPRRENGRRDGHKGNRRPSAPAPISPQREPKKDSDLPLYGKIN